MSQYAIKRSIEREQEWLAEKTGTLNDMLFREKEAATRQLARSLMQDFGSKEFVRDRMTGMLTINFHLTVMEDSEVDRIRRNAASVGKQAGREEARRDAPYGLDEVYE